VKKTSTEPYISTYLHRKGRKLGLPIAGNFELTARCNFDCPMCYVHLSQEDVDARGRELTAAQWIEIAREARDQGMIFVLLTGGEPFVRKDFFEIYGAMKKMGLLVSINSNGSMLSGEIRRKLLEDPPYRINISLYGGCGETYQNMCGQPVFDRVVENIAALKAGGIDVSLNLSVTPYNRQDVKKIYDIARELNIQVRSATYMYPPIRVNGEQYGCGSRLTPEEAAAASVEIDLLRFSREEFARRAVNIKNLMGADLKDCPTELEEGVRCRAGSSSFWMTWDGRMLPCGMMPGPEVRPLELGFSEAWKRLREETAKIRTPSQCAGCPKKDVCGVCAAVCVTETGRFDCVPSYACRQTDAFIEKIWEAYLERNCDHNGD